MKALDRQTTSQTALQTARRAVGRRKALGTAAILAGALGAACGLGQAAQGGGREGGRAAGAPVRPASLTDRAPQPDSAVLRWNEAALAAIRATRPAPPVAARALAILHTAIYDAWAPFDAVAVGTAGLAVPTPSRVERAVRAPGGVIARRPAPQRTAEHKRAAVSAAAHLALRDLFPTRAESFDALLTELGFPLPGEGVLPGEESLAGTRLAPSATPAEVGMAAARAVLESRRQDGANQEGGYADTTGYAPINTPDEVRDPNRWQPLRVPDGQGGARIQECAVPHWRQVRPFALASGLQLRPTRGPQQYAEGGYRAQAEAILRLSAGLTERQKAIAEYWSDGPATETPPGHWCLLAREVSRRDGHDLDRDVILYFALTNALLDASIACWDAKRAFDYVRPVTAIRHLFRGRPVTAWAGPQQGTRAIDGGDWHPFQAATFVTPAFPEFVSGHSTFSAAAAEVLQRFTGSDAFGAAVTIAAGSSAIEPGRTPERDVHLRWETFSAAAAEAGMSRRYGGIHFEDGDLEGQAMGRAVGAAVWARVRGLLHGSL